MRGLRGGKIVKHGVLQVSRATGLTALARTLTRNGFNIVGFHGVSLADEHLRFPTLFISPEAFERRLRFLSRRYRIVPLDAIVEQHRAGRIRPRQVVLTFDDGFYNFLGAAIPLLKQYGAPATVYVVTAEVESGEPLYNLLLRDVILSTKRSSATGLPHAPELSCDLSTRRARDTLLNDALGYFTATCGTAEERLAFCRTFAAVLDVDVDAKLRARLWDRLTPSELETVVAAGYDVQLHTHTHRNVIRYGDEVRDEVRTNRQHIERLTGKPAVHFCYPLGLWHRGVWPDLRAEGVESAVTTRNGPNYPATPPLALRRYLTGQAMTDLEFEFELSGLRWLTRTVLRPAGRFEPSEKRLRYAERPELY